MHTDVTMLLCISIYRTVLYNVLVATLMMQDYKESLVTRNHTNLPGHKAQTNPMYAFRMEAI